LDTNSVSCLHQPTEPMPCVLLQALDIGPLPGTMGGGEGYSSHPGGLGAPTAAAGGGGSMGGREGPRAAAAVVDTLDRAMQDMRWAEM
jgi:hypothetical protein